MCGGVRHPLWGLGFRLDFLIIFSYLVRCLGFDILMCWCVYFYLLFECIPSLFIKHVYLNIDYNVLALYRK